jgi:ribosomal protein S1
VELEPDLEGLLHTSRMGGRPAEGEGALRVGEVIDVEVVKVDPRERKIGLALVTEEGTAAPEATGPGGAVPDA